MQYKTRSKNAVRYSCNNTGARVHYIYRYKGREGGRCRRHAVHEITTRGHPRNSQEVKKGSCSTCFPVCLFFLSCLSWERRRWARLRHPKPCQPPRLCLVAAHGPNHPDHSRPPPEPHRRHPEPSRLSLVAAQEDDRPEPTPNHP